ncbi:WAS/WASL-interacting protein family member 2-like isoform X2 [Syngnathoides biaculeatus]|uniref:WAS/WASL-interacting protein family member 2-like isoform X2 n=1 Tax=Syngnathoides biaculeatus TaxID=300417 RepID=UPI002ADDDD7D|nr:WAS/WASL-interacting protein family member 2-like isoform X2 [Syngnathoides biaculeatus]XP_061701311.1 WAS/WASL-interacting protein family member 2-like isoform X2 [Syngnathoides biaculeatus]XP_061701313.1 WAS/WASL-interacting protein family member 2-like isoform X2 [Syngnathoides biaculeatus]
MSLPPPPPPPFAQANRQSPEEVEGGPAHLLPDLSRGTDHPYFRLYQYLHQGAPHKKDCAAGGAPLPRPPPNHHRDDVPSPPSPPPPRQSRRGQAPSPPAARDRNEPLPLELLQRRASPGSKGASPSPGAHPPTRGPAPPPPPASPARRPTPPPAGREAPPPPPCPSQSSEPPVRGKPPPPPPPPLRRGLASSIIPCLADDFESKYLFHPLDDFPPPDEYRHVAKIYPSKAYSAVRGAPPLPPVGR